ncbi:MAG: glycosyltransferase family A protein [Methylovirgula sp.]
MIAISAILTAHREGLLIGPTLQSYDEAIAIARTSGLSVEPIIVLDRSDSLTKSMCENGRGRGYKIIVNDDGDPGLSRNRGVKESQGEFITFLDGDDLWSANWLVNAHEFCRNIEGLVVGHSECNLVFGREPHIWFHADSEAPHFNHDYLRINNYWDAMSFAAREIYLNYPFVGNDLASGYGHEDWHWNCVTLSHGISHRPVPGTIHAKRQRAGSQSARCMQSDVVIWPNPLSKYSCTPAQKHAG